MTTSFDVKKNGNFAVKIVIGFAVVIGILVAALLLVEELDYDSFKHLSTFEEVTQQSEEQYLVYFYSDKCSWCASIKNEVLAFADNNDADIKVYFANTYELSGTNAIPGLTGTPSIVHIVNGIVVTVESGAADIPNYFDTLEANAS